VAARINNPSAERAPHIASKFFGQIGRVVPIGFGDGEVSDATFFEYLDHFDIGLMQIAFDESDIDEILIVAANRAFAVASVSKRWVRSVWKAGAVLFGSSCGRPPQDPSG
jgi:hypothetical protein